jgi:hypothetical protein
MNDITDKQTDRLDFLHSTVHRMLCALAGQEIEEDISVIAEICDLAEEHICNKLGLMTDMEFAPYVEDPVNSKKEPEPEGPCVAVISSDGGWGKGKTLAEAFKNCPYKTPKTVYSSYAYTCSSGQIEVDGMGGIHYPRSAASVHLGLFKGRLSKVERKKSNA